MTTMITIYEVAWGAAGLIFALGGAGALDRSARRAGRSDPCWPLLAAPSIAALLTLGGARLHAMLGAPGAVWDAVLDGTFWTLAAGAGLRIGGGLLLATAFLLWGVPAWSGRRLAGLEVLDAIVPVAGLSIFVGRFGCFFGGCCFGEPSGAPWAVHYPTDGQAYWNHVAQGLLPDAGGPSLPVHPLSLYLGVAAGLSGLAALGARRWARGHRFPPGVAASCFVACMSVSRLFLEPLRETRFLDTVPAQRELDLAMLAIAALGAAWLGLVARQPPDADAAAKASGPSSPGMPSR